MQDLTASNLFELQARINQMFANGGPPAMDLDPNFNKAISFGAAAERNTANATPLYNPDGTCRGVNIYHVDGGFTADDTDVSEGFTATDCDLPAGQTAETVETEYAHNLFVQELFEVTDGDCANLFIDPNPNADLWQAAAELVAPRLARALVEVRSKLNTAAIGFLDANATTVNRDLNLPTYINFNSPVFEVNKGGFFQDVHSLTEIQDIITTNDMMGAWILNGRNNFRKASIDDTYFQLDDDKRNVSRWRVDNLGIDAMYFDINRLDSTLGGANTFAVMPGSYALWNVRLFGAEPRLVDTTKQIYQYSIADPGLVIAEGGRLRPVFYNVFYQKICTGTNINGVLTFKHRWMIRYLGGIATAPPAEDTHTGILKFTDVYAPGI
jgi:hypothetical protein